jgi:dTDP-L-rhamnose 4-epimerase
VDSLDPLAHKRIPDYLNPNAEYIFADLRYWQPDERLQNVEAVVHFAALGGVGRAAKEPGNVVSANVLGWARLLEFARSWPALKRVVLASSFSVYGQNYTYVCPHGHANGAGRSQSDLEAGRYEVYCTECGQACRVEPITVKASPHPLELYGSSKYMQELCLRGPMNAASTILRFSSVYGKRLRLDDGEATIIAKLASWVRDGINPTLFEDGRQIRDWVYTGDIVDAVLKILDSASPPALLNVCSGQPATLLEAIQLLCEVYGTKVTPIFTGGYRFGDMRHCLGDPAELMELIGRKPLSFQQGVEQVFAKE